MKLEELGLGVDVATRLRKNGCNSVEDLCELTIENLEEIIRIDYVLKYDGKYFTGCGRVNFYYDNGNIILIEPALSGTIRFVIEYTKTTD